MVDTPFASGLEKRPDLRLGQNTPSFKITTGYPRKINTLGLCFKANAEPLYDE
jgi:hypothetical protein